MNPLKHHSGALPAARWLALVRRPGGLFRGSPGDDSKPAFVFALIFFLLATGIAASGYFYYRNYERQFLAETEHKLSAVVELKVGELAQWRKERMADGGILFKNASFSALVRRFLEKPEDPDAQQQVRSWIDKYKTHFQYDAIRLLDTQGVTRISSPAGLPAVSSVVAEHASDALRSGQVTFQDFYRSESDQKTRLAILVPILDEAHGNRPLGVLVLRIDPAFYLYPFIQRWPVPSETAETLLLRRDGNDVLYLNDLRHQTNTPLALRIPLTRTEVPAVRIALGQNGIIPGADYRGMPVLAAALAVPDSPWFMVAKIDRTEVNAPLRVQLWQVVVMVGILLFGAGAGVGLVWRQQRARFYRERAKSAETLQKSRDLLAQAEEMGKVGGWELDIDTRLLTWTKTVYDIHEVDSTVQPTVDQGVNYYTPASRPVIERAVQRAIEQGEPFDLELEIITAKGNLRSVHAIGTADLACRKVSGFFQDISERKRVEESLRESEEKFRTLVTNLSSGVVVHAPDTSVIFSNPMASTLLGLTKDQMHGKQAIDPTWSFLRENGMALPLAEYPVNRVMSSGAPILNQILGIHRPDLAEPVWVQCSAYPDTAVDGTLLQVVVTFMDITERRQANETLLQSRRAALNLMTDAVAARDRAEQMSKELALNSHRMQVLLQLNQMREATLKETTDFALEEAVRLTQSTIGYLAFLNEDESVLTMHAWSKSAMAECAIIDKPIIYPVDTTGLWGEAVRQRRPVFTNDYAAENPLKKGYPQGHVAVKRHMNVPVFEGSRIVLVAGVGNKNEEYSENDAQQLTLLMEGMWRLIERRRLGEELQESETRLSTIFKNDPTGIFIVNVKTRIIYDVNDSALEIFGLPRGDVVGKVCHRFLCPAETGCCPICDLGQLVDRSERVLIKPDGTRVPILKSVVPIQLKGEDYLLESFIDITDRKQAEEAVKQNEEKYRNLFDNAMEGVFQTTPEGHLKSANMALARMFSYKSPEEMINATTDLATQMYANPDDRKIAVGIFKEKGYIKDFECQMRRKDGSIFWARYDGQFTKTEDGIPCFQGFIIDITDRKQTEVALIKSESMYRNIFDNSTEGIFQSTPEGRYISVNPAFARIGGYGSPEEMIESVTDIQKTMYVHQEDRTRLLELLKKNDIVNNFEAEIRRKDNIIIWISMNVRLVRDQGGKIIFLEGTIEDITDRKGVEEEIKSLNLELEQRVIARTTQLEAANKELEAFSYSVSHDLRAPLRTIDGFSKALLEEYQEKLDDTGKSFLERVRKATQRMGLLIDDMLKLSRITQAEMKRGAVDLSGMVRELTEAHQKDNTGRTVDLTVQEWIVVQGDPYLLKIAMENLLDNAFKFTGKEAHPRIEFGTTVRDGKTVCFIRDNGAGFDMAYVGKLFSAFQRLHASDEFPGTGIGLATVKRIIDRHGGQVWAEGEIGKGATFYFTLCEPIA